MTSSYQMPAGIELGPLSLTIQDLSRSLEFYQGVLGMKLIGDGGSTASLSFDDRNTYLELVENRQASLPRGRTGLYHFALLVPSRPVLANTLKHLLESDYPLAGASDHGVSEAIYLSDPDGNGIEIYRDRQRQEWPMRNDELRMDTRPLDAPGLLKEVVQKEAKIKEAGLSEAEREWAGLDPLTVLGHVHLKVASIPESEAFYVDLLGFQLMQRYGPSASFVSAGGYHHHIGFNTWESAGAQPPHEDAAGLRWFGLVLPDEASLDSLVKHLKDKNVSFQEERGGIIVRDPSENVLFLTIK
jgi:catechol 2,3-dioxygenase